MKKNLPLMLAVVFFAVGVFSSPAGMAAEDIKTAPILFLKEPYDHSIFSEFLKKYVDEDGYFNYRGAKDDTVLLDEYLAKIKKISYFEFKKWPREEKIALLMNAYHAGVIKHILNNYPVRSIQDIPGVWELAIVEIENESFSLNRLRNKELIEAFKDEKIHLALACGARGCPRMRREAFDGQRVEGQLFMAAQEFVNDETYNILDSKKKVLRLSTLFKWYSKDFVMDFGSYDENRKISDDEAAVVSFYAYYLKDFDKLEFLERGDFKLKYITFDWKLNEPESASVPMAV